MGHGDDIIGRFPEHSPIHEPTNPLNELIQQGIGKHLDAVEDEIFQACDERFLPTATGERLDLFGEWFGVKRLGKTDDEYRAAIIAVKSSNPTVDGLKRTISTILNIEYNQVIVINGAGNSCKVGTQAASHYDGDPCIFAGHTSLTPGIVTIKIPQDCGRDLIEDVIDQLVLASVTVYLIEY